MSRRPSDRESAKPENYLPCINCKAWIFEKNLSLHSKTCPGCDTKSDKNFLRNGRMMLAPFIQLDSDDVEIEDVFDKMKETRKHPGLKKICKNDLLIKEFCRGLIHKLGTAEEQRRKDKDNIRTKVRAVARLLVALNDKSQKDQDVQAYIRPGCFMLVVDTVKNLGRSSPNLSLTLGHYLKQLCQLKRSISLQTEDEEKKKEADHFDILYDTHWNNYVSAVSLRRLKLLSLNKPIKLPLTTDLVKLKDFLDDKIDEFVSIFKPTYQQWNEAAQVLMVRLVIFNKRRISEVEELKVADLTGNQQSSDSKDVLGHLDITERALAKRMRVIEVRGKSTRGLRKVFIILSEQMNKGCLHLLETRMYAGIAHSNPYLFARCENSPLDGCQAMRNMSEKCPKLESPELVRSRLLRKYLATTVQILDMTGDELKMVADHMGHSVAVHTDIYRLQTSLLEKTKVARALIAIENGQISKFSGRTLGSCMLEEIPVMADEEEDLLEDSVPENGDVRNLDEGVDEGAEELESEFESEPDPKKGTKRKTGERDDVRPQAKVKHSRKRWTTEEEKILLCAFKGHIDLKTNPSMDEIRKAQDQYPCLRERSIAVIKSKLNNIKLGKCSLRNQ